MIADQALMFAKQCGKQNAVILIARIWVESAIRSIEERKPSLAYDTLNDLLAELKKAEEQQ